MTTNKADDGTKAVELKDDDLDAAVGAGPISNVANFAGKTAGKVVNMASNVADKVTTAVSSVAQDVTSSGDAFLSGFNQTSGEGGGDTSGGGSGSGGGTTGSTGSGR